MSFCRFVFAPPKTSASPFTGGVPRLQFPPTDQRLFTAPVHVFVAAPAEAATSSNAIARRRTEFMMSSIRTAGETRWGSSDRDLPRHAEAAAELVVDEVRDPAAPVALETTFAVEARGDEGVVAARGEDVPLPAGLADQEVAGAADDDDAVRLRLEAIRAGELVEHARLDAAEEVARRRGDEALGGDAARLRLRGACRSSPRRHRRAPRSSAAARREH